MINDAASGRPISSTGRTGNNGQPAANMSSYEVFIKHYEIGGPAAVVGTACYREWIATRKEAPKRPEESFRRSITAHLCKSSGRRPFSAEVEADILRFIRRKEAWPMAKDLNLNIGSNGFRAKAAVAAAAGATTAASLAGVPGPLPTGALRKAKSFGPNAENARHIAEAMSGARTSLKQGDKLFPATLDARGASEGKMGSAQRKGQHSIKQEGSRRPGSSKAGLDPRGMTEAGGKLGHGNDRADNVLYVERPLSDPGQSNLTPWDDAAALIEECPEISDMIRSKRPRASLADLANASRNSSSSSLSSHQSSQRRIDRRGSSYEGRESSNSSPTGKVPSYAASGKGSLFSSLGKDVPYSSTSAGKASPYDGNPTGKAAHYDTLFPPAGSGAGFDQSSGKVASYESLGKLAAFESTGKGAAYDSSGKLAAYDALFPSGGKGSAYEPLFPPGGKGASFEMLFPPGSKGAGFDASGKGAIYDEENGNDGGSNDASATGKGAIYESTGKGAAYESAGKLGAYELRSGNKGDIYDDDDDDENGGGGGGGGGGKMAAYELRSGSKGDVYESSGKMASYESSGKMASYDASGKGAAFESRGKMPAFEPGSKGAAYEEASGGGGKMPVFEPGSKGSSYEASGGKLDSYEASGKGAAYESRGKMPLFEPGSKGAAYESSGKMASYESMGKMPSYESSGKMPAYESRGKMPAFEPGSKGAAYEEATSGKLASVAEHAYHSGKRRAFQAGSKGAAYDALYASNAGGKDASYDSLFPPGSKGAFFGADDDDMHGSGKGAGNKGYGGASKAYPGRNRRTPSSASQGSVNDWNWLQSAEGAETHGEEDDEDDEASRSEDYPRGMDMRGMVSGSGKTGQLDSGLGAGRGKKAPMGAGMIDAGDGDDDGRVMWRGKKTPFLRAPTTQSRSGKTADDDGARANKRVASFPGVRSSSSSSSSSSSNADSRSPSPAPTAASDAEARSGGAGVKESKTGSAIVVAPTAPFGRKAWLQTWLKHPTVIRHVLSLLGLEESALLNPNGSLVTFLVGLFNSTPPEVIDNYRDAGLDMFSASGLYMLNGALEQEYMMETTKRSFLCPEGQESMSFEPLPSPKASKIGRLRFDLKSMMYLDMDPAAREIAGGSISHHLATQVHASKMHIALTVGWGLPSIMRRGYAWTHMRFDDLSTRKRKVIRVHWKAREGGNSVVDVFWQEVTHCFPYFVVEEKPSIF
ncbi:Transcription elongation factor spt5 [Hondaea fermentalgiana]|uniref:Transcription elongation factor spt5 n=1 Tax=Hondaea fermentalgiana TaxID=2315210 RepID=A0A2R5G569_9STRA|nr:Transcription elongation factor spt5 [Hondaea fermentalgiana]|eukprot:GBG26120.1 Transcription elongation factor spt5 [Hondaea fermentalgiana]